MANVKISNLTALWNTSSVEYNGIKLNITDTTSSLSSKAIDLKVNDVSIFKVGKTGITTAAAFIGNFTGSLTGSFYGTATTASSLTLANSYNITNLTANNISASGYVSASSVTAATSMISPIGNFTNLTANNISASGYVSASTIRAATSVTSPIGNITNLTASNISASGYVSASTMVASTSMTSPIGNITNLTSSNISASGYVSASTIAVATSMTSPNGNIANLTSNNISASGFVSASTIRAATSVTSPIGHFTNLTASSISASNISASNSLIAKVGEYTISAGSLIGQSSNSFLITNGVAFDLFITKSAGMAPRISINTNSPAVEGLTVNGAVSASQGILSDSHLAGPTVYANSLQPATLFGISGLNITSSNISASGFVSASIIRAVTSMTSPVGNITNLTSSNISASGYVSASTVSAANFYGTATTASSLTLANSYNITNLTASNISASGYVSASSVTTATSMTSPIGNFTNLTANNISASGFVSASTIRAATSVTSPIGNITNLTASNISASGYVSASTMVASTSMTSPIGNITNLTSSNISASGYVSASTIAVATSMTSPNGNIANLTSNNISASGFVSASTIRAVTSVTSPIGHFTNLTASSISASNISASNSLIAKVGEYTISAGSLIGQSSNSFLITNGVAFDLFITKSAGMAPRISINTNSPAVDGLTVGGAVSASQGILSDSHLAGPIVYANSLQPATLFGISGLNITSSNISASGFVSASTIRAATSMTSPSGNITNLTSINISASGYVSASAVSVVTSMTSPSGNITNLTSTSITSSNISASGFVSASTVRSATSVTSPSGNFTNLTASNISASGFVSASILTSDKLSNGLNVDSIGIYSHAEGNLTTASGNYSHAEGRSTIASGEYTHAEGFFSKAYGNNSHAEGTSTESSGSASHAEGAGTVASGSFSHAEGYQTVARGLASHAEGSGSLASGTGSHAEGLSTTASADYQHVSGKFNVTSSNTNDLFIIGNGTSTSARSNILVVNTSSVIVRGNINATTFTAKSIVITGSLVGTPEMYGAVGDGITDDQLSFKHALISHSLVELSAKTYAIRGFIGMPSYRTLRGKGKDKTIIKVMDNSPYGYGHTLTVIQNTFFQDTIYWAGATIGTSVGSGSVELDNRDTVIVDKAIDSPLYNQSQLQDWAGLGYWSYDTVNGGLVGVRKNVIIEDLTIDCNFNNQAKHSSWNHANNPSSASNGGGGHYVPRYSWKVRPTVHAIELSGENIVVNNVKVINYGYGVSYAAAAPLDHANSATYPVYVENFPILLGGNRNLNYTSSNTNDLITDGVGDSKFKGNYVLNSEVLDIANVDLMNPFSNTTAIYVTNQSINNATGQSIFSSEGGIYNCTVNPGDNYKPTVGAFFAGSFLDEHESSSLKQSAPSLIEWLSAGGSSTGSNGDYAILNGPNPGGSHAKKISGSWYYSGAGYATQQHYVNAYSGYRVFNSTAKHVAQGFYLDSWRNNAYVENNQFIDVDNGFRSVVSDIPLTSSYNNVVIKNNYVKLARQDRKYINGHATIFYGVDQATSNGSILRHIDNLVIENNIFELPISSSKSIYHYPPYVAREYPRYIGLWIPSEVNPSGSQPNLHRSVSIKNNNFVNWNPVKSQHITPNEPHGYNLPFFFTYHTSSVDFDTSDNPSGPYPNSLTKFKNITLAKYIIEGNIYNDSIYPSTSSLVPITFHMVGTGNQYYYPVDQVSRLGDVTAKKLTNGNQALSLGDYSHAEGGSTLASGLYSHAEGNLTTASVNYSHAEGSGSITGWDYTGAPESGFAHASHAEGILTRTYGIGSHAEGSNTYAIGIASHTEGFATTASGNYSHAEGSSSLASGRFSHAEGNATTANGYYSHAEGSGSIAGFTIGFETVGTNGVASHAEGVLTVTREIGSHSEGIRSYASGSYSHAEGQETTSSGRGSHAEGSSSLAAGIGSHAEGLATLASGLYSHAEGQLATASATYSHAEGLRTHASGFGAHAEGSSSLASGTGSHTEGTLTTASGQYSHAEGSSSLASGIASHAEGQLTTASAIYSHAEGLRTHASGFGAHAEGSSSLASGTGSHAEGIATLASGLYSHAEGHLTTASGDYSHAEGSSSLASGTYSHAEGNLAVATGLASHAEGWGTLASESGSHAEGRDTVASGIFSHAEGWFTKAASNFSHAEGVATLASGLYSHAEGQLTTASATYSHAEGLQTHASGFGAHAEGSSSLASGTGSHAEGFRTTASGNYSHAEGSYTTASGVTSHAEGSGSLASGIGSHAEGISTLASGLYSHAEGHLTTASGDYSHAEGSSSLAIGTYSHAEGNLAVATGLASHAEGWGTLASESGSHAEGRDTVASGIFSHAEGWFTKAASNFSHAEGVATLASGLYSHAEGQLATASAIYSHAEGLQTHASGFGAHAEGSSSLASGTGSHAEGFRTTASGNYSHAEGLATTSSGDYSHAEGRDTVASGQSSHAEGWFTKAASNFSHAEGIATLANGLYSHAEGQSTTASADYQHVSGKFNVTSSNTNDLFIIGNGTSAGSRSNILVVNTSSVIVGGNLSAAGNVGIGTTVPFTKFDVLLADSSVALFRTSTSTTAGKFAGIGLGYAETGSTYLKSMIVQEQTGDTHARGKIHILNSNAIGTASAALSDARVTIQSDGNVGIGTTSPAGKLHVSASSTTFPGGYANNLKLDALNYPTIWFNRTVDNTGFLNAMDNNGFNISSVSSVGTPTPRVVVSSAGNVGIGTASPGLALDVTGDFRTGNVRTYSVTRTLGVSAGDFIELGTFTTNNGSTLLEVTLGDGQGGGSAVKQFIVARNYDDHNTSNWFEVLPLYNTGPRGGDYTLDEKGNAGTLRIRRTSSALSAHPITATIKIYDNMTFTATSISGSAATVAGLFRQSVLTQVAGNVGIGTPSPNTKLEVSGTFRAGNTSDTYMTYDSAADNITLRKGSYYTSFGFDDANSFIPTIGFSGGPSELIIKAGNLYVKPTAAAGLVNAIKIENTTGTANVSATGISLRAGGNVSKGLIAYKNQTAWGVGDLTFGINSSADNTVVGLADARMTIQGSNGNVGIGTTSPSCALDVAKAASGETLLARIYNTSESTTENHAALLLTTAGPNGGDSLVAFNGVGAYIWSVGVDNSDSDKLKIGESGTVGGSTHFTIASGGNVGIGTTSPSHQLTLSTDSATKPSSNVWSITSDERIKTNIVPADLSRCYEIVKQVGLKHFGFKPGVYNDGQIKDKHTLGFIAQDVQKVFGKAVSVSPFTLQTDIPDGIEEYEEQDFTLETVDKVETSIQVINGKPVQVSKVVTSENKVMLFDMVDVLDESGAAVMESYEVTPAIAAIDATEEVEAVESIEAVMGTRPVTYKMPRMITKTRPKVRREVIEDCLDLNGGQMNAALYGAVQCLMAKVEAQAVTIAALQTKVGE